MQTALNYHQVLWYCSKCECESTPNVKHEFITPNIVTIKYLCPNCGEYYEIIENPKQEDKP